MVASAAICAALYAIVNALTSLLKTPWGVGEFRPGVIIPGFFAVVAGPIPAAIGAGVGSFVGDMVSLVPAGGSTPFLALFVGAPANFIGFLVLGWVFQKFPTWKGFIIGTTSGLFLGNLFAAEGVGAVLNLPQASAIGLLLFWFGTMFPFVVIFVPALVRFLKPQASKLTNKSSYPEITEPNPKVLWTWSVLVSILVIAAMLVIVFSQASFVQLTGGTLVAWEALFLISAASVLIVGAFIPRASRNRSAGLNP